MSPDRFGDPGDPLVQFLYALKRELRIHYLAMGGLLLVIVGLFALAIVIRGNDLQRQNDQLKKQADVLHEQDKRLARTTNQIALTAAENRRALILLCATSSSFDNAITSAATQIKFNFANGTYARLVRQGFLTEENVAAAKQTLKDYEHTHKILSNPVACKEIGG